MNTLYLITRRETQECYIGWTSKDIKKYWKNHHISKSKAKVKKQHIHHALAKYGSDAFTWEIISFHNTVVEAKLEERYWIARFREFNISLYNKSNGGEGLDGFSFPEETRKKMSESAKRKPPMSAETKLKLSQYRGEKSGMYGKSRSIETKQKISAAKIGKKLTEIHKAKIAIFSIGESNGRAKLSEQDVLEMRYLYDNQIKTQQELMKLYATKFDMNPRSIEYIIKRRAWKHLP